MHRGLIAGVTREAQMPARADSREYVRRPPRPTALDVQLRETGYEVPLLKALNKQQFDFLTLPCPGASAPASVLK